MRYKRKHGIRKNKKRGQERRRRGEEVRDNISLDIFRSAKENNSVRSDRRADLGKAPRDPVRHRCTSRNLLLESDTDQGIRLVKRNRKEPPLLGFKTLQCSSVLICTVL